MSLHLDDLEHSACISCGKDGKETILVPIQSGTGVLLACGECISKFGHDVLGREADKIIASAVAAGPRRGYATCRHCGTTMAVNPEHPFWCDACEDFRRGIVAAASLANRLGG